MGPLKEMRSTSDNRDAKVLGKGLSEVIQRNRKVDDLRSFSLLRDVTQSIASGKRFRQTKLISHLKGFSEKEPSWLIGRRQRLM